LYDQGPDYYQAAADFLGMARAHATRVVPVDSEAVESAPSELFTSFEGTVNQAIADKAAADAAAAAVEEAAANAGTGGGYYASPGVGNGNSNTGGGNSGGNSGNGGSGGTGGDGRQDNGQPGTGFDKR
jgi:uncharacterized membrane protein YgcG